MGTNKKKIIVVLEEKHNAIVFSVEDFIYELKKTATEEKNLAIKKRITQIAHELVEAERAKDTKQVNLLQSEVAHLTGKIQETGTA
jgi:PHD/YefM family antitoxin component YafN of YafNO toxin-antitoxin module